MNNLADRSGIEREAAMKEPSRVEPRRKTERPRAWARGREIKANPFDYLIRILFATAGATLGRWTTSTPS